GDPGGRQEDDHVLDLARRDFARHSPIPAATRLLWRRRPPSATPYGGMGVAFLRASARSAAL
ncbi:MAG TPA: hypothetical protein VGB49_05930, partial [Caulobacteraceae bacterium]